MYDEAKINLIIIDIDDNNFAILTNNLDENYNLNRFKDIKTAFEYLIKLIKFIETFIILNEELRPKFIEKMKENLKILQTIPKIFILNHNENESNIFEKDFYIFGKMNAYQMKKYLSELFSTRIKLINEKKEKRTVWKKEKNEKGFFCFEYNAKYLYKIYREIMENISNEKIEEYNEFLFNNYSENTFNEELFQIYDMHNIPIELLSKYYIKLYSNGDDIYTNMKYDLMTKENGFDSPFIPFVKIIYNAMKKEAFNLSCQNKLYCSTELGVHEKEIIKNVFDRGNTIPISKLIFSKRFLSFSEDLDTALKFKKLKSYNTLLELDINYDKNEKLATYSNIQKFSKHKDEKEILFFPFSAFTIKDFKEKENEYIIKLSYQNIINKVNNYCEDYKIEFLKDEQQHNNEINIFFLGEIKVGKKSITNYIKNNYGVVNDNNKICIKVNNNILKFELHNGFDERQQLEEIFSGIKIHLFILVYSIDNRESFDLLENWLNIVRKSFPYNRIFLLANKNDLEKDRKVLKEEGEKFKEEKHFDLFKEVSAKTGYNIKEVLLEAGKALNFDSECEIELSCLEFLDYFKEK